VTAGSSPWAAASVATSRASSPRRTFGHPLAQVPTTLLGRPTRRSWEDRDRHAPAQESGRRGHSRTRLPDLAVLATLPPRQLSSGLAEVTKCRVLADRESVAQLARSLENVRAGDLGASSPRSTIAPE